MSRRLTEKPKYAPRKPKRFGSQADTVQADTFLQSSPVKENQELEVVIDDIESRGDRIARLQGYLIFVPRSKIGERVKVRIVSFGGKFAVAEKMG